MLKELIDKNRVVFKDSIDSWEEAVRIASEPLLRDGTIQEGYVTAMIKCVNEYGPYIIIAPDIAFPHARGEFGVNETSISFLKVERPVKFSDSPEHAVRLLFVLASVGGNSHMELLQSMITELSDAAIVNGLLEAKNIEDLRKVFGIEKTA